MKILLSIIGAAMVWTSLPAAEPLRIKLFPEGTPSSNGLETTPETVDERGYYFSVSDPELEVFLPDAATATGQAVLVVSGGGYEKVCVTYEGYKTAEWLNARGIAAMVLKYRMPNGHPQTVLEDGAQAMRVIRRNAAQWNVDPRNIGAMGFSAGGHFVSTLITGYPDEETRPDFAVLVYPVISMDYSSARSRENLLGAASEDILSCDRHSTHKRVHEGMPEVLLALCDNDKTVVPEHSLLFYKALKQHGIKAEMHIYPAGGHGFWMRERYRYGKETYGTILRWIEQHKTKRTTK